MASEPIRDHLGAEFPSRSAMCRHWGVEPSTFRGRLSRGWTVEQALTGEASRPRPTQVPSEDHEGATYPSVNAMCEHWGIPVGVYYARVHGGWDLERALTEPVGPKEQPCKDHLGNKYPSIKAMCDRWGVSYKVYSERLRKGKTLEQALTTPVVSRTEPTPFTSKKVDCLGNEFPTVSTMARAWGVDSFDLYQCMSIHGDVEALLMRGKNADAMVAAAQGGES